jgi:hypothetical protein
MATTTKKKKTTTTEQRGRPTTKVDHHNGENGDRASSKARKRAASVQGRNKKSEKQNQALAKQKNLLQVLEEDDPVKVQEFFLHHGRNQDILISVGKTVANKDKTVLSIQHGADPLASNTNENIVFDTIDMLVTTMKNDGPHLIIVGRSSGDVESFFNMLKPLFPDIAPDEYGVLVTAEKKLLVLGNEKPDPDAMKTMDRYGGVTIVKSRSCVNVLNRSDCDWRSIIVTGVSFYFRCCFFNSKFYITIFTPQYSNTLITVT